MWGDTLAVLRDRKPAARIINLETAITRSSKAWPKGINYRMHPANVGCLTAAQIDCCVLANNHVLDWGTTVCWKPGTLRKRESARRGRSRRPRRRRQRRWRSRKRPEFWCSVSVRRRAAFPATGPPLTAGRCEPAPRPVGANRGVPWETARAARKPGDVLVASLHWGSNWGYDFLMHNEPLPTRWWMAGSQSCTGIHRIMQRASNSTVRV